MVARAGSTIDAAPRPEGSHLVPGVEKNDAEAGEVLDVPRHESVATVSDFLTVGSSAPRISRRRKAHGQEGTDRGYVLAPWM
jgi:hypothetical protein